METREEVIHEEESTGTLIGETSTEAISKTSTIGFLFLLIIPMVATLIFGAVDPIALGIQIALVTLLSGVWLLDVLRKGRIKISSISVAMPLLMLILVGLIQLIPIGPSGVPETLFKSEQSSHISYDFFATRFAVIQLTAYLLFALGCVYFLDSGRRIRATTYAVIFFATVTAFFGILQFLAKPDGIYGIRQTPFAEPFGPFVNRHHFAAFMEMSFGLAFALFLGHRTSREKRMLLLIAMVLAGISVVLTGSRGGVLSMAVVGLFVLAASLLFSRSEHKEGDEGGRLRNLISSGVLLVAIFGLVVGSVLMLGGDKSLIRGLGGVETGDFSTGRIHFWQVTWEVFKEAPVIGVGLDSLPATFTKFDTWNGEYRIEQAHNDYLQILAEAGVIGAIAVIIFIVVVFRKGLRNITEHKSDYPRAMTIGALGGILGILVHSFFDFPLRTPSNGYFFLILAVLATSSVRFHVKHHHGHRRRNGEVEFPVPNKTV